MKIVRVLLPLFLLQSGLFAQKKIVPHNAANLTTRNEVQHAIDKGLAWLQAKQDVKGFWDMEDHPAITAMILTAIQRDPSKKYKDAESTKKGYAFLLSCVHPDGGIYKKDILLNYNTSISIMALLADDPARHETVLRNARQFLVKQQMAEESGKDNTYAGGIGYGDEDPHSDLSNMQFALEALKATKYLQSSPPEKPALTAEKDLNWEAAIAFVQSCQNLSSANKAKWVSSDVKDKGGFVYSPTETQAEEVKSPDGSVTFRSYGSMTYAGMLSYIYAGMKRDDPRITAVVDWISHNYTTEENPGVGQEGLYYYYQTVTKALATYGQDKFKLADGREVDWRNDFAKKLINLQHEEGFWRNENNRHWEKDSVLATAYTVLALEYIYQSQ